LLGQVPLYQRVMEGADRGQPIVVADPQSTAAKALVAIAERVKHEVHHAADGLRDR
jgi:ATP-binding protein involved in chromosome partitioning